MDKSRKKEIRREFRVSVLERDGYACVCCGTKGYDRQDESGSISAKQRGKPHRIGGTKLEPLDAHHIIDRNRIPGGGYVVENGITLCTDCHIKAEVFHSSQGTRGVIGFMPIDMFEKIGGNPDEAYHAAQNALQGS